MDRNFGTYEIATPKMVKEDHANAKIYIGGGVKADNTTFETFNGTITGVEVYDGALTAEQVAKVFSSITGKDITGANSEGIIDIENITSEAWTSVSAGTAWTISMDVENPNGASFNQWGSSIFAIGGAAFPEKNGYRGLQFYLQSSTNGGIMITVSKSIPWSFPRVLRRLERMRSTTARALFRSRCPIRSRRSFPTPSIPVPNLRKLRSVADLPPFKVKPLRIAGRSSVLRFPQPYKEIWPPTYSPTVRV